MNVLKPNTIWWKYKAPGVWFNWGSIVNPIRRRGRRLTNRSLIRHLSPFRFHEGFEVSPQANLSLYDQIEGFTVPMLEPYYQVRDPIHIKRANQ